MYIYFILLIVPLQSQISRHYAVCESYLVYFFAIVEALKSVID